MASYKFNLKNKGSLDQLRSPYIYEFNLARNLALLSDDPAVAAQKILSATTDNIGKITFDLFNQPGISNLLQIESLLTGQPLQQVISRWTGQTSYSDFKHHVATTVKTFLTTFQSQLTTITDQQILAVLKTGETHANTVANTKLHAVQTTLGLRQSS